MQEGAAMSQYIKQPSAALRYKRNMAVMEKTTSVGRCGFFPAAFYALRQPVFMTV